MKIIGRGQTDTDIIITLAIPKEPLRIPCAIPEGKSVDERNFMEEEIINLIKNG